MTEEQIKKEYSKLLMEQIEATTACNYYLDKHIHLLLEIQELHKEWKSKQSMENLSDEELDKLNVELTSLVVRIESADELRKVLGRLKEKSQRKMNEINHKIAQFSKRHGVENAL